MNCSHKAGRKHQSACEIQAIFRGFLGRNNVKEQWLLRKLKDIEDTKRNDLQEIESRKGQENHRLRDSVIATVQKLEGKWEKNSAIIAHLIPVVQAAREENAKLKRELVSLKQTNQRLAIKNRQFLSAAAKCERKVNCVERCGMELHCVVRVYSYKQCLSSIENDKTTKVDCSIDAREEGNAGTHLSRFSDIQIMLDCAEAEDNLLIINS